MAVLHDADTPAFAIQKEVDPAIAMAHMRLADLFDPLPDGRLFGVAGPVFACRAIKSVDPERRSDRDRPPWPHHQSESMQRD